MTEKIYTKNKLGIPMLLFIILMFNNFFTKIIKKCYKVFSFIKPIEVHKKCSNHKIIITKKIITIYISSKWNLMNITYIICLSNIF